METKFQNETALHEEDSWSLDADQMIFMLQHHNPIEDAYERNDMDFLTQLEQSDEYIAAFGDMGWDEAYDRYETMIDGGA